VRIVTQYKYDDASDEATDEINRLLYDAVKKYYKTAVTFADFRNTQLSPYGIVSADKIGPSIAKDMTYNAIYAVFFSLIAIGLYITLRFKKWQWATGATLSLAHDARRRRSLLDAVCRHAVQPGDQPGLHRCDPDRDRLFDQQHGGDLRPHPRVHRALSETEPA